MAPVFRLLADGVVVVHFGFLAYVVAGGFLAWRWRWSISVHAVTAVWAVVIVLLGPPCPLTGLQDRLRVAAGLPRLRGGFVDTYVEGAVLPTRYTGLVQACIVLVVLASWWGWWLRRPDRPSA